METVRRRHPSDAVRVFLGSILLVVASLPVRPDAVGRAEAGVFDAVNGLPDWLLAVLYLPMQAGWVGAVPLLAVAALALRRWRLALDVCLAGFGAWFLAAMLKDLFVRPRPGGLLETVVLRGGTPSGLGFVSGHTAVATALATVVVLHLPRRWRPRVYALAAVVALARLYVGAHLPLDVVGGAAVGWVVGAGVRLALGAPTGRPSVSRLADRLGQLGFVVEAVEPLSAPAQTSAVFRVSTADEGELFAKVLSDRPQDRDALYRWWQRARALLAGRAATAPRAFASPRLQVEHEAVMLLAAANAGARVPSVVFSGQLDRELAVLLTRWVEGQPLSEVPAASMRDEAHRQLSLLHDAGLFHGDLRAENLLVVADGPSLVDFGAGGFRPSAEVIEQERSALADLLGEV